VNIFALLGAVNVKKYEIRHKNHTLLLKIKINSADKSETIIRISMMEFKVRIKYILKVKYHP